MRTITNLISSFWIEGGHLTLDILQTSQWYTIIYQLAFFVSLCIFIYAGVRRKYPMSTWLIISVASCFLMVLGSKLGSTTLDDWKLLLQTGSLSSTGKKTALGAVLFVVLGMWLIKRSLRFVAPVWGAFAFFVPVMMLVQRVGCMMAGCCYGKPTEAIGGVKYFGPSILRDRQIHGEVIPHNQFVTEAVHNVPLYFILVAATIILLLVFLRKRITDGRKLLVVSIGCMLVGRFFVDFFRDVQSHNIHQDLVYGLKPQQWILILVFVFLLILLFRPSRSDDNHSPVEIHPMRNLLMLMFLSCLMLVLQNWFTSYEKTVLYAQMLIAVALNLKVIWGVERQLKPLVMPLVVVLTTTVLMAQNVELNNQDPPRGKTYLTGALTQNRLNQTSYPCLAVEQGCLGEYCALGDSLRPHGPNYNSLQLGVEHEFARKGEGPLFRVGLDFAMERYNNFEEQYRAHYFHISPYVRMDWRYFGMSLGVRTGQLFNPISPVGSELPRNSVYRLFPRIGFSFGSDQGFFKLRMGLLDDYMPNGIMPAFATYDFSFLLQNDNKHLIRSGLAISGADFSDQSGTFYYGLFADIRFKESGMMLKPGFGVSVPVIPDAEATKLLPQFSLMFRTPIGK